MYLLAFVRMKRNTLEQDIKLNGANGNTQWKETLSL